MNRTLLIIAGLVVAMTACAQRTIIVKKGNAESLLNAVKEANKQNADKEAKRLYILIPDGVYDLGERVLTQIKGHNIAFIGQSTQGTVILNKPDYKNEGISKTAVFQNRGSNNYFQDLTLHNDLDYYACKEAGRAVTLHDKGTRTILNRVRLLSYQDTYYSDNEHCQHYFSDCEIHGTVDFICGNGDVWFERCLIVTEKRSLDENDNNRNVIAAPRTEDTPWGYIFHGCTIENIKSPFDYARGWKCTPHCIWLNTTLLTPEKLNPTRFDYRGMRTVMSDFKEYATKDAQGHDITPQTNVITYQLTLNEVEGDKEIITEQSRTEETILTPQQAAKYTLRNVFGDWHPDCVMKKIEKTGNKLINKM